AFVAELLFRPLARKEADAIRVGRAGIDADDTYAVIDAARADRARKSHQRGVADRAGGVVVIETFAGGADHVDDDAFAARFHKLQIGAGEMDVAVDLELPARAPSRVVDIVDR